MDQEIHKQLDNCLAMFERWLTTSVMSAQSRRVYRSRLRSFITTLDEVGFDKTYLLSNAAIREKSIRAYKEATRTVLKASTINGTISTVNLFFESNGLSVASVEREFSSAIADKTLTKDELYRLNVVLMRLPKLHEQALVFLLLCSGLKISECANLNVEAVSIADGILTIQSNKGLAHDLRNSARTRQSTVPPLIAEIITQWISVRSLDSTRSFEPALFVNRNGQRMSTASIDIVVRKVGWKAGLVLSAEMLRRTHFVSFASPQTNSLPNAVRVDGSISPYRYNYASLEANHDINRTG